MAAAKHNRESKWFKAAFKAAQKKHPEQKKCSAGHDLTNPENVFGGAGLAKGLLHCMPCDKIRKQQASKATRKGHSKSAQKKGGR